MDTTPMSEARTQLMLDGAKKVRAAIAKRDAMIRDAVEGFDRAAEHGSEQEVMGASIMLLLMVALVDPVGDAARAWQTADKALSRSEGRSI